MKSSHANKELHKNGFWLITSLRHLEEANTKPPWRNTTAIQEAKGLS